MIPVILDAVDDDTQDQPGGRRQSRARISAGGGATNRAYPKGFVPDAKVLMLMPSGKWEPGIIRSIELYRYYES